MAEFSAALTATGLALHLKLQQLALQLLGQPHAAHASHAAVEGGEAGLVSVAWEQAVGMGDMQRGRGVGGPAGQLALALNASGCVPLLPPSQPPWLHAQPLFLGAWPPGLGGGAGKVHPVLSLARAQLGVEATQRLQGRAVAAGAVGGPMGRPYGGGGARAGVGAEAGVTPSGGAGRSFVRELLGRGQVVKAVRVVRAQGVWDVPVDEIAAAAVATGNMGIQVGQSLKYRTWVRHTALTKGGWDRHQVG